MIKLERFQDYFTINDVPYQRGKYRIRIVGNLVGIAELSNNLFIVNLTIFSDWNDGTSNYTTLQDLRDDLRLSLFISGI